jgi:predicted ATPase/DNA-binding CsgD family transcriptional regulator
MSRPNLAIVQQRGINSEQAGVNNLPAQPTPIVGRESEIASLSRKLLQQDVRLLTLVGPGGVGKSRLAVQVAEEVLPSFKDGVWFVGLGPISDPSLVIPTVAQTLDLHAPPGHSILSVLKEYLRDKQLLLLLDNFEQVMSSGAPLADLLASCPLVKLLVTSRSALHLRSEHEFPVPPLSLPNLDKKRLPDPEALQHYSAVALFGQRAAAVRPDFTINSANAAAVVEICARLDGLPLAIELVAARVKLLSPGQIQQRLQNRLQLLTGGAQDLPARQQTLRSAIEWSYDLLNEQEQTLFRRLAVFVGGCTLEAAEAVCGEMDVLDGIGSLIDKSLLRPELAGGQESEGNGEGESHYSMLETIREYALDRLEASGNADRLRDRHAIFFRELAERAEPQLTGASQREWYDRLEHEHDNFRAALKWCLTSQNGAEVGLRTAASLGRFWNARDYRAEGREWLRGALARPEAAAPTSIRAKALQAAATIADNQGDYEALRAYCRESLEIRQILHETQNVPSLYILMAKAASHDGNYGEARSLLEESLEVARNAGDMYGSAHSFNGLGELERLLDNYEAARKYYDECLQLFRRMGNTNGIGFSLHNLAYVCMHDGEYERAAAMLDEGLGLYKGLGNRLGVAMCVSALAGVALHAGEAQRAARLLGAAQALLDSIGALLDPADAKEYALNEEAARERLGEAAFLAAWAEGNAMTPEQVISIDDVLAPQAAPAIAPPKPGPAKRAEAGATSPPSDLLSAREMDVLRLISRGLSDAEVANRLFLSPHTVRAHVRSIYSKIGVTSRSAATRYAAENGIT